MITIHQSYQSETTDNWGTMASRWERIVAFGQTALNLKTVPLFCAYLTMIMLSGVWQRNSRPLSLRPILVIYNFGCAAISLYTLIGFGRILISSDNIYSLDGSRDLKNIFFWYWITKIVELLDTVFMVLRHKRRQISILHVYHHASMLLLSDLAYHHFSWTAIAVILALNTLVHVVLYFYYGLSALFPNNPPPWKKRVTELQILQFFIDLIFGTIGYLYHGFCIYGIIYGLLMVYLFMNFYYHAYIKPRPSTKTLAYQNGANTDKQKKK